MNDVFIGNEKSTIIVVLTLRSWGDPRGSQAHNSTNSIHSKYNGVLLRISIIFKYFLNHGPNSGAYAYR